MNVKRASAVISLILIVILIGVVIVDIGPDQTPMNNSSNGTDNNTPVDNNTSGNDVLTRLPTGLTLASGDLLIDQTSLVERHNRRLSNNSVKVRIAGQTDSKTIMKEGQNILVNDSNFIREELQFSDGDYTLTKTNLTGAEEVTYGSNVSAISRNQFTYSDKLALMLSNLNITQYEVRNDSVYIKMETNQATNGNVALTYGMSSVDKARMDIVVDETGYVRSAEVSISGTVAGGVPTVKQESYAIEEFGSTEVEEPSWTDKAESQTTLVSGVLDSDKNYIQLNHRGLEPLNSGESVQIVEFNGSDIASSTIELNRTVAQGSVLYLVPKQSGAWEIFYNDSPEVDGSRELQSTIVVSGGDPENSDVKFEVEFEQ